MRAAPDAGRAVIAVSVLASFVAFLDGSVVNLALPAISADLGGGLALQQWVLDGYLLTLGALILVAGAISDEYGRLRVLRVGLAVFAGAAVRLQPASATFDLVPVVAGLVTWLICLPLLTERLRALDEMLAPLGL